MDLVLTTSIDLDILANGFSLGDILVFLAAAPISTVQKGVDKRLSKLLDNWHQDTYDHCPYDRVTDQFEPRAIEVLYATPHDAKSDRTLRHIRIHEEKQDRRIDELHPENNLGRLHQSFCFLRVVQDVHKLKT